MPRRKKSDTETEPVEPERLPAVAGDEGDAPEEPEEIDEDEDEDEDEDDDSDEDEDDGDQEDDKFDQMLAKLTGAAPGGANGKPGGAESTLGGMSNMILMLMMDERRQARKEARENQREMRRLKAEQDKLLITMLANKDRQDPVMAKLMEVLLSGKQQEATVKNIMDMQAASSKMQLESFQEAIRSTSEMKDRMLENVLSRAEDKGGESRHVAVEVIKELKDVAEPLIAAFTSRKAQPAAVAGPAATAGKPGQPALPAPAAGQPDPLSIVVRTLHHVHTHPDMSAQERRKIRTSLATVIMDVPGLADAIVANDQDAIANIAKPAFVGNMDLMAWIAQGPVQEWLAQYLDGEIADVLDAIMEVERPAAERERDSDDEDEDEDEDEDQGGNPPDERPPKAAAKAS